MRTPSSTAQLETHHLKEKPCQLRNQCLMGNLYLFFKRRTCIHKKILPSRKTIASYEGSANDCKHTISMRVHVCIYIYICPSLALSLSLVLSLALSASVLHLYISVSMYYYNYILMYLHCFTLVDFYFLRSPDLYTFVSTSISTCLCHLHMYMCVHIFRLSIGECMFCELL